MNRETSVIRKVPMLVARNPVARAVERANLKRWFLDTALQAQLMEDGEPCASLIYGMAEAIGMAIKATEGCEDPAGLHESMTRSMGHLVEMTNAGQVWIAKHAEDLCDSLDAAVQLLVAVDPRERVRAWAWVKQTAAEAA